MSPHLPGAMRMPKKPPRDDLRDVNPGRRTPDACDAAILTLLAHGPLMKWELRDMLHEPEHVVYKRLLALRAAKKVRPVGKRLASRQWALTTYQEPPNFATIHRVPEFSKKDKPPATSWWAEKYPSREAFDQAQHARSREAGWTGKSQQEGSDR